MVCFVNNGFAHYSRIFLTVFCAFAFVAGHAQVLLDHHKLTIEDGLAERIINAVERDSFGFFYLWSDNYLQRYDGRNFVEVDVSVLSDTKTKLSNFTDFATDASGNMVLLTDQPTHYLYYLEPGALTLRRQQLTSNYTMVSDGSMIYLSKDNDGNTIQFFNINEQALSSPLQCDVEVTQACKIDEDTWIIGNDSVLYSVANNQAPIQWEHSGTVYKTSQGLYVVNDTVVYQWDKGNFSAVFQSKDATSTRRLITHDQLGRLIVGYGEIPRFVDELIAIDGDKTHSLDSILRITNVMTDVYTNDIFHRAISVGYTGVFTFNMLRNHIHFVSNRDNRDEMFGFIVSGIAITDSDQVYYLNEGVGIHQYLGGDTQLKIIKGIDGCNDFVRNGKLYYDKTEDIVLGVGYHHDNSGDIRWYDYKNNNCEKLTLPIKIQDLWTDLDGQILTGGYDESNGDQGVLLSVDKKTRKHKEILRLKNRIYDLYYDKKLDLLFIGTREGMFVYDRHFVLQSTMDKNQYTEERNIDEDFINYICRYQDYILAGSIGGGLYVLDDSLRLVTQISKANGLSDNKVVGTIVDNQGYCWISTFNGLNVLDKDLNLVRVFYQQDGLPDKEFNTNAIAKDSRGQLYFGTVNGMLILHPESMLQAPSSEGIYIASYHVHDNEKIEIIENVEVWSSVDSVQARILYPDYYQYPFTYRAMNYDGEVPALGKINKDHLTFSQFRHGSGAFTLRNKYNDYTLSQEAKIKYDYRSILMILGALLGMGLIAYLIYLRKKQRMLEQIEINKKIAGLELSALQSQMNPHFLFNALGAIQYFIQTHNADMADEYLSNFALLMRLILESSKSKYISIDNEVKLLELYIGLEKIRFEEKFDSTIDVDDRLDGDFKIPPMIVQPYVENAINHGLIHLKDRRGTLNLSCRYVDEDTVQVIVQDNGIGRQEAQKYARKNYKSRGMQIVKERIDNFNTEGLLEAHVTINDLYDNVDIPTGTQVILTFKDKSE